MKFLSFFYLLLFLCNCPIPAMQESESEIIEENDTASIFLKKYFRPGTVHYEFKIAHQQNRQNILGKAEISCDTQSKICKLIWLKIIQSSRTKGLGSTLLQNSFRYLARQQYKTVNCQPFPFEEENQENWKRLTNFYSKNNGTCTQTSQLYGNACTAFTFDLQKNKNR